VKLYLAAALAGIALSLFYRQTDTLAPYSGMNLCEQPQTPKRFLQTAVGSDESAAAQPGRPARDQA
jgi:hypothetical protein